MAHFTHIRHRYYIWDVEPETKPIILVREDQVQALLSEINNHLNLQLSITAHQREEGLLVRFPHHPRCSPRYLGRSSTRDHYNKMVDATPADSFRIPDEPAHSLLEGAALKEFKDLMEELWDVQRAKSKVSKAKKQQEMLVKQKSMADSFKRAQRYLALRPSFQCVEFPACSSPRAINASSAPIHSFDQTVVFVCIDVEAYERAHHKITEVGVATLDTRDLNDLAPGHDGEAWRKKIRARHFRINENRHLVNSEFVDGHPDKFRFGESTLVSLREAAQQVTACFSEPFGLQALDDAEASTAPVSKGHVEEKRNIILLGHDTLSDVRYLQQLGCDLMKDDNIVDTLDTAVLYRVWRREQQATSLSKILYAFDIDGFYVHNAGNDAVFTVQAMLAICVREATLRGSSELHRIRREETAARVAAAVKEARARVEGEEANWGHTDTGGDGGAPVPLSFMDTIKSVSDSAATQYVPRHSDSRNVRGQGKIRGRGGLETRGPGTFIPSANSRTGRNQGSNVRGHTSNLGGIRDQGHNQLAVRESGRTSGFQSGRVHAQASFNSDASSAQDPSADYEVSFHHSV